MKRRALLRLGAGATAFVLVGHRPTPVVTADAHERSAGRDLFGLQLADLNPDRMWPVYRRYHLLIVGQRDDGRSSAFTAAVVDVLSHFRQFSPSAGQRRGCPAHRRAHRYRLARRRHHAGRKRRGALSGEVCEPPGPLYRSNPSPTYQKLPRTRQPTDLQTKDRSSILVADTRALDFRDRGRADPLCRHLGVLERIVDREHHILHAHGIEGAAQRGVGANA